MTYSEVFKHLGHYLVSGGVTNSSLSTASHQNNVRAMKGSDSWYKQQPAFQANAPTRA